MRHKFKAVRSYSWIYILVEKYWRKHSWTNDEKEIELTSGTRDTWYMAEHFQSIDKPLV